MSDLVERLAVLRSRAEALPAASTNIGLIADLMDFSVEASADLTRLTELVQAMIDNDPNDDAADGVSVLDVWRKNAHDILQKRPL